MKHVLSGGTSRVSGLVICLVRNMNLRGQTEFIPRGHLVPEQNDFHVSKTSR